MMSKVLAILYLVALFTTIQSLFIDQEIILDSSRDVGAEYSLFINGPFDDDETGTFTIRMTGPENVWMGVILGKENMTDAPAYVYYVDPDDRDSGFILAERYFPGNGIGELVEIIPENGYNISTIDGITTLEYTRSWIGDNPTSFSLSEDNLAFLEYGFARGTSEILAYHTGEFRSHSEKPILHLCCNCNDTNCDSDPQCQNLVCDNNAGFDNRCCRNEWRPECTNFALGFCVANSPIDVLPPCCGCLQASGRGMIYNIMFLFFFIEIHLNSTNALLLNQHKKKNKHKVIMRLLDVNKIQNVNL